jgi:hypothetical protein
MHANLLQIKNNQNKPSKPFAFFALKHKIENYYCKTTLYDKLNLHLYVNDESRVLIYGCGGLGKTSLASEYSAYIAKTRPNHLVKHFKVDTIDLMITNYVEYLFDHLEIDPESLQTNNLRLCIALINQKLATFAQENVQFLFVFDSFVNQSENFEFLRLILKELPDNVKAIITSRSSNYEFLNFFDYQIELKAFDRADARVFLMNAVSQIISYEHIDLILDLLSDEMYIPFELQNMVEFLVKNHNELEKAKRYFFSLSFIKSSNH